MYPNILSIHPNAVLLELMMIIPLLYVQTSFGPDTAQDTQTNIPLVLSGEA